MYNWKTHIHGGLLRERRLEYRNGESKLKLEFELELELKLRTSTHWERERVREKQRWNGIVMKQKLLWVYAFSCFFSHICCSCNVEHSQTTYKQAKQYATHTVIAPQMYCSNNSRIITNTRHVRLILICLCVFVCMFTQRITYLNQKITILTLLCASLWNRAF